MSSLLLIKNVTLSDIAFSFGDTIEAGVTDNYTHIPKSRLLKAADLIAAINASDVVVSDGTQEFNAADGIKYLNGTYVEPTAGITLQIENLEVGSTPAWNGTDWVVSETNAVYENNEKFASIVPRTGVSKIPIDVTPTITDGTEICSLQFSLNKNTNRVRIIGSIQIGTDDHKSDGLALIVFRDNVLVGGSAISSGLLKQDTIATSPLSILLEDFPGDTAVHTYSVRAGTLNLNHRGDWFVGRIFANTWGAAFSNSSSILLKEV